MIYGRIPRSLLAAGIIAIAGPKAAEAQAADTTRPPVPVIVPRYFTPGTFGDLEPRQDSLIHYIFGKELAGAREPSLAEAGPSPTYRISVVGGWGLIRLIRIEAHDSGYVVVRKATVSDTTSVTRRRLRVADSAFVRADRVVPFEHAFAKINIWTLRWFDRPPSKVTVIDGDMLLVEVRVNGRSKLIERAIGEGIEPAFLEMKAALDRLAPGFLNIDLREARVP